MFTSRSGQQIRIQAERASTAGVGTAGGGAKGVAPAGVGAGMKTGAGHKPQAYDASGRYTGPNVGAQGGSISLRDGLIRMYAQGGGGADENDGGEDESREKGDASLLSGLLLAENGRAAADAGGGFSGGNEFRGPVTPPLANIIWKNDEPGKADPKPEDLRPQMREALESMRAEVLKLDSAHVNSGRRSGDSARDPHADGRAVDINRINGIPVKDLKNAKGNQAERAQEAAANLEEWAKTHENINQVIGPNGGWGKKGGKWVPIENPVLLNEHKDHYHINVFRK